MTVIAEQVFNIDVPGDWGAVVSEEPGTFAYAQQDGPATLRVMLLKVRPLYSIADRARLLDDYVHHRMSFEAGETAGLQQSEPETAQIADWNEGTWDGLDEAAARRHRHRVILRGDVLADFRYETSETEAEAFDSLATPVLGTAFVEEPA